MDRLYPLQHWAAERHVEAQLSSARLRSAGLSSARLRSARPSCCSVSLLCSSGPGDPGGALNTQPECIMRAGRRAALFTLESILFIERSCSTPRHSMLLTAERRRLHLMLSNAPRCHVAVNRRGQGQLWAPGSNTQQIIFSRRRFIYMWISSRLPVHLLVSSWWNPAPECTNGDNCLWLCFVCCWWNDPKCFQQH